MPEIVNTGERILIEKETPLMIARHFCAYRFAMDYVSGKNVLDVGCGEGYGANYLAEFAESVKGIDYDKEVIAYAKNKYNKNNLKFQTMDIKDLSAIQEKFGIICSFQNIEHIKDTDKLLNDVFNLLNENGIFICSTCNMKDASPGRSIPFNRFHVREYMFDEFQGLLEKRFRNVELSGLKRGFVLRVNRRLKKAGIFNFLPSGLDPVKRFYSKINCDHFCWAKKDMDSCLDFIAVCKKIKD